MLIMHAEEFLKVGTLNLLLLSFRREKPSLLMKTHEVAMWL